MLSGTTIRGTPTWGLRRPQKRKTRLGNRAHSANRLVIFYSHDEPRRTVFLRSEGEEGLVYGDPGEEEATNDDNFVVTLVGIWGNKNKNFLAHKPGVLQL